MAEDPWLVQELEDHVRFSSIPETRERATAALGGPSVTLDEAFPDWPRRLADASGGDVRGALDFVRSLFADAGLDRIVLVDQTSREHADAGIHVARAVVPGILPMCFGHAQQRLAGLPRLEAALRGTDQEHRTFPTTPTRSRDGARPAADPRLGGRGPRPTRTGPAPSRCSPVELPGRGRQQHRARTALVRVRRPAPTGPSRPRGPGPEPPPGHVTCHPSRRGGAGHRGTLPLGTIGLLSAIRTRRTGHPPRT